MTRVTIDDVARTAGASTKTVSRVLNNEPNVRESLRQRVLSAVTALNYRPLTSARSLATNRSFIIGLLYDNRSPSYIMEVQAGVLEACAARHYSMMVLPLVSTAPDFVERVEDTLSRHQPDGLILTPPITDHPQLLDRLRASGLPFASIAPRRPEGCIGVMLREREAAAAMVGHLVSLGHRRIAHILGDPEHGAGIWRLAGYRDGLKRAGLKERPDVHDPGAVFLRLRGGGHAPVAGPAAATDGRLRGRRRHGGRGDLGGRGSRGVSTRRRLHLRLR